MKRLFICLLVFAVNYTQAQITKVTIQASGLTCSMCSNSINKALKSLEFVDKVDANIKNSSFDISFKPNEAVDFDKLKKKVEGAGFFVANFTATIRFDNVKILNDSSVNVGANTFHFLNVKQQILNGDKTIRLLDKGFLSTKEYKKNTNLIKADSYKKGLQNGNRVFHVTI